MNLLAKKFRVWEFVRLVNNNIFLIFKLFPWKVFNGISVNMTNLEICLSLIFFFNIGPENIV